MMIHERKFQAKTKFKLLQNFSVAYTLKTQSHLIEHT